MINLNLKIITYPCLEDGKIVSLSIMLNAKKNF